MLSVVPYSPLSTFPNGPIHFPKYFPFNQVYVDPIFQPDFVSDAFPRTLRYVFSSERYIYRTTVHKRPISFCCSTCRTIFNHRLSYDINRMHKRAGGVTQCIFVSPNIKSNVLSITEYDLRKPGYKKVIAFSK